LQISGRKRVIVFPAEVSDEISQEHYVELEDENNFFSERNLSKHSWLNRVPYYDVEIGPGEAVIIPSAALSFDSISINTFLTPKMNNYVSSQYARKPGKFPWWFTNFKYTLSKFCFDKFGFPLLKRGLYEIM